MGVDWRLYVATLVAVLIFFGLGILVGIGLTREPTAQRLEGQIRRLEARLSEELRRRDERIRALEGELQATQQRWQDMQEWLTGALPLLTVRRLQFRNIAIIACAPDPDGTLIGRLQEALKGAGANVPFVLTLNPDAIQTADSTAWRRIAQKVGLVADDATEATIKEAVWKRLALLVRYGDPTGQLNALVQMGWAKVAGSPSAPVGSVVLLSAFEQPRDEEQVQTVDLPLLRALKGVDIRTVACETAKVGEHSVVEILQTAGVATVDHADTPMGLLCIIAALTGHTDRYGLKNGARQMLPPVKALMGNP
ncbi:MAG: hypothetical protein HZLCBSQH_001202 [Candidatus Fervidibacterota bacterium]